MIHELWFITFLRFAFVNETDIGQIPTRVLSLAVLSLSVRYTESQFNGFLPRTWDRLFWPTGGVVVGNAVFFFTTIKKFTNKNKYKWEVY